jgi:hypothetical protein
MCKVFFIVIAGALGLVAQAPTPAAKPMSRADTTPWAVPHLAASAPRNVVFKGVTLFRYQEQSFSPPYRIEAVDRRAAAYSTPEAAMVSRASAIMTGNLAWWLDSWDDKTRAQQVDYFKANAAEEQKMVTTWKQMFVQGRMEMLHKITYGKYVILTYRVVNKDTGQGGTLELPTIFHQEKGLWKATNDLRADPLLPLSPWSTGKASQEEIFQ